jgi:hypothetical protein
MNDEHRQPQTGSRRPLFGGRASAQRPAGQELVGAAHALDKHYAVRSLSSSRVALQKPSLQRLVDRPAEHHLAIAQVV